MKDLLTESLPTFAKVKNWWKLASEALKNKHDWCVRMSADHARPQCATPCHSHAALASGG
jgi:hypothetical protein